MFGLQAALIVRMGKRLTRVNPKLPPTAAIQIFYLTPNKGLGGRPRTR